MRDVATVTHYMYHNEHKSSYVVVMSTKFHDRNDNDKQVKAFGCALFLY